MAAVEFTVRRRGRDEENFAATQALKKHERELLNLDSETVRVYLDENNLLKVNENKTLRDGTKSKKEKMKYVLNETNCIKGTRGLLHILEMLRSLGGPSYTELANKIDTDYNKRMEEIRRQYPRESQPVNVDRFKKKTEKQQSPPATFALQEKIVTSELKIIVLGDNGVGKTSLLIHYCTGKFSSTDKRPAISGDGISCSKPLERSNHHYELKFWDTHVTVTIEMEKHNNAIPSVYYRGAVGALLIYDVTNPQSLNSLQQWWRNACNIIMKKDGQPIPAVLLANKSDLGDFDETIELCDELKRCKHFSTSAKRGEGISEAIECLLDDIIKEGLVEKETECWTEMPDASNSIRLDPDEVIQKRMNCSC